MNSPFDILLEPSDKSKVHTAPVKLVDASGRYKIGPPQRPPMNHDNGFLDKFPRREPTAADRVKFAEWVAVLKGSEALCNESTGKLIHACGGDLTDANAAYRHFLFGNGADRTLNYERFLQNDPSGQKLIPNLSRDFQQHVEIIGKDRLKFSVTSSTYNVGRSGITDYPQTANWQKAIGAHYIWVSADVTVSANAKGEIIYTADLILHMEDRYNFNPGQQDAATGIPDSANGRFETCGLAKQYTNFGTVKRHVSWKEGIRNQKSDTAGAPTGQAPQTAK